MFWQLESDFSLPLFPDQLVVSGDGVFFQDIFMIGQYQRRFTEGKPFSVAGTVNRVDVLLQDIGFDMQKKVPGGKLVNFGVIAQ